MSKKYQLESIKLEDVERISKIMGDTSAAAKAINELTVRRQKGECVDLWIDNLNKCFVVGPTPVEATEASLENAPKP